jgi:hypothetical protein
MNVFKAHQLLHGYRGGHGQLSASVKLASRDSELVTRLSDLSGSLSSGSQIDPYITAYPLPSGEFFAIARTWPDLAAARAGCVLTHTILIPLDSWAALKNIHAIDRQFTNPRSNPDYKYTDPIDLLLDGVDGSSAKELKVDVAASRAFVSRYFGQGVRPVVWFNAVNPEEHLWRLLEHLWPQLRCMFSCCTYSLQPRLLQDRPFDLLFAPPYVFSRFTKLSPDHLIEAGVDRKGAPPQTEPWCEYWAKALFSRQRDLPSGEHDLPLWSELGDDPGAARKLYLVHEMQSRAAQSPMAGVGAMDLVESLARDADAAVPLKRMILKSAVEAASSASDVHDALTTMHLIEDRLGREAFRNLSGEFKSELELAVARWTAQEPMAAIEASEGPEGNMAEAQSAFNRGVLRGLHEFVAQDSARLGSLSNHAGMALRLLNLEPGLAASYLQTSGESAPLVLTGWLTDMKDPEVLRTVRRSILPILNGDEPDELLSALLRDLAEEDVSETLDDLSHSSNGFSSPLVLRVVIDRVCNAYPLQVRQWARKEKDWKNGVSEAVAATFSDSRHGFSELLSEPGFGQRQRAEVLARMLGRYSQTGSPYWLREMIAQDSRLVESLVTVPPPISENVEESLCKLLTEGIEVSLSGSDNVVKAIRNFEGRRVFPWLVDIMMRGILANYVSEGLQTQETLAFSKTTDADNWLRQVTGAQLSKLLVRGYSAKSADVSRAWNWLSSASAALYQRRDTVLPEVFEALIAHTRQNFGMGVELDILSVLRRAKTESPFDVRQAMAARSLRFGFDNIRLPLGAVTAESFADVYSVASKNNSRPPSFLSVFFWSYDWDRGKELRVALVDAFLRSDWMPADLAIAAERAGILGKIFKRVRKSFMLWFLVALITLARLIFRRLCKYGSECYTNDNVKNATTATSCVRV